MSEKTISEEQLLISALQSDDIQAQKAYAFLVSEHSRRLYSTIRRWLRNHEDTNDVLQETFIKVWRHRNQFEGTSSIFSWMYRIAYNEAMQFLRKAQRRTEIELDIPIIRSNDEANWGNTDPETILQWLGEAIQILPEKQRIVFEYRYYDDLKYEEIVQLIGGTTGGLKANYFHAVQKVEEYLKCQLNQ